MVTAAAARRLWEDRIRNADHASLDAVGRTLITKPDGSTVPDPATYCEPTLVTQWMVTREIRTVVHDIRGAQYPTASLRPAGPRSGTLEYLFDTAAEVARAEGIHALPGIVQLIAPDVAGNILWYLPQGRIDIEFDIELQAWRMKVDFHERPVDLDRLVANEQPLNRDTRVEVTP